MTLAEFYGGPLGGRIQPVPDPPPDEWVVPRPALPLTLTPELGRGLEQVDLLPPWRYLRVRPLWPVRYVLVELL